MALAVDYSADAQVRAITLDAVERLDDWLAARIAGENQNDWRAHYRFGRFEIDRMRRDPASIAPAEAVKVPPGEPIGSTLDR